MSNKQIVPYKKKPAPTKKKSQPKRKTRPNVRRPKFFLSSCSEKYLKALCDPFSENTGVCIPDINDQPSAKYRTITRGTMYVGADVFGCITVSGSSKTRNGALGCASLPSYGGSVVSSIVASCPAFYDLQCPFSLSDFTDGRVQGRVVARGLRVRYSGTELNRGGVIIPVSCPTNFATNGSSAGNLMSRADVITYPCDRRWHGTTYRPTRPVDYTFSSDAGALGIIDGPNGNMSIVVSGGTTGNAFEFEIVSYYEYIAGENSIATAAGLDDIANLTDSHADLPGLSQVRNFFGRTSANFTPGTSLFQTAKNWISSQSLADVSRVVNEASSLYASTRPLLMGL